MVKFSLVTQDSVSCLEEKVEVITKIFSPPETEDTWESFNDTLQVISDYFAHIKYSDAMKDDLKRFLIKIEIFVNNSIKSERTRLSRTACQLLEHVSSTLTLDFQTLADAYFVPNLLKVCMRANKVSVTLAHQCLLHLVTASSLTRSLPRFVDELSDSKSTRCRQCCVDYLSCMLEHHAALITDRHQEDFSRALFLSLQDASQEVRLGARRLLSLYELKFPYQMAQLVTTLDAKLLKQLFPKRTVSLPPAPNPTTVSAQRPFTQFADVSVEAPPKTAKKRVMTLSNTRHTHATPSPFPAPLQKTPRPSSSSFVIPPLSRPTRPPSSSDCVMTVFSVKPPPHRAPSSAPSPFRSAVAPPRPSFSQTPYHPWPHPISAPPPPSLPPRALYHAMPLPPMPRDANRPAFHPHASLVHPPPPPLSSASVAASAASAAALLSSGLSRLPPLDSLRPMASPLVREGPFSGHVSNPQWRLPARNPPGRPPSGPHYERIAPKRSSDSSLGVGAREQEGGPLTGPVKRRPLIWRTDRHQHLLDPSRNASVAMAVNEAVQKALPTTESRRWLLTTETTRVESNTPDKKSMSGKKKGVDKRSLSTQTPLPLNKSKEKGENVKRMENHIEKDTMESTKRVENDSVKQAESERSHVIDVVTPEGKSGWNNQENVEEKGQERVQRVVHTIKDSDYLKEVTPHRVSEVVMQEVAEMRHVENIETMEKSVEMTESGMVKEIPKEGEKMGEEGQRRAASPLVWKSASEFLKKTVDDSPLRPWSERRAL